MFKYASSINLLGNELQNAAIHNLASAPGSPVTGQIFTDTSGGANKRLKYYDGVTWQTIANLVDVGGAGMTNPMTTLGDMIVGGSSGVATRLAGSTTNGVYILSATTAGNVAGSPTWLTTTGSGSVVLSTSPSLTTPSLGVATATSINKVAITAPTTSATLTLADGSSLVTSGAYSLTLTTTGVTNVTLPTSGTLLTTTGTAAKATNLVGAQWAIPYQSATDTTSMLANPAAANRVLLSGNNAAPTWSSGTLTIASSGSLSIPGFAVSFANAFSTSGAYSIALTATGVTTLTLPTTGTLVTLAGSEALTNKTINGLTLTALATGFSLAGGTTSKILTVSNTITLAGTDSSTLNIGSGGTLGTNAFSSVSFLPLAGGTLTNYLTLHADPTNAMHAATKQYVDATAVGLRDFKDSCRVATTGSNINLAAAPNTLDGVSLAANDRILVKDQTTPSQNGLYYVATLGTGANGVWTRTTDADTSAEVTPGMYVIVEGGSASNKGAWVLATTGAIVLGTTSLNFTKFSSLADLSASAINTALGYTVPKPYATTITGAGPTFTITHNLNTKSIHLQCFDENDTAYAVEWSTPTVNTALLTFGYGTPGAATHRVVVVALA